MPQTTHSLPTSLSVPPHPHVVFVHGNGDTEALWITSFWRFESNGWPRERLHSINLPYPVARDRDDTPQAGRSSSTEHWQHLAKEVARIQALDANAPQKVVLIANSRGGYAVRNFIANGGAAQVSHAILGGTPNHGVWANAKIRPSNEFNGQGPMLLALNARRANGLEVEDGIHWMTLRSDGNDKYAQPTGEWVNMPGVPTGVDATGPALDGARDVVLIGADHREVSFSRNAFIQVWRFLTGTEPRGIAFEAQPVLDGKVSAYGPDHQGGLDPNNLPLAGALVEVFATDRQTGERLGDAVHRCTVGADGRWGPFTAQAEQPYEFVVTAPGWATSHVYRPAFARSSQLVHLRAQPVPEPVDGVLSTVTLSRPRGYFDRTRDHIAFDGACPPADIPPGVAGMSMSVCQVTDRVGRSVVAEFNRERIVGLAWPLADGHVVTFELHD